MEDKVYTGKEVDQIVSDLKKLGMKCAIDLGMDTATAVTQDYLRNPNNGQHTVQLPDSCKRLQNYMR